MELVAWWLSLLLILVLVIAGAVSRLRNKKRQPKIAGTSLPVANSYRLIRLPEYQKYFRRYKHLISVALLIVAVSVVMIIILAGRPTTKTVIEPESRNRDIMLCLDVSGSMYEADSEILRVYAELSKGFKGERIGLVLFDSSPVVVFPLTDDYDFVAKQLESAAEAFKYSFSGKYNSEKTKRIYDLISGVYEGDGSSLIGDGLAGCVNRFDKLDHKRSRSIIFGTDNYLAGRPVVTLKEAAEYAKDKDIRVYGINPADYSTGGKYGSTSEKVKEFKESMLLTNGDYYKMTDIGAVPSIIDKVTEQEATRFKGTPQIVYSDQTVIFLAILLISFVALMIISWRLRV